MNMNSFQYHIFSPYRVCPLGAHVDHQHGLVTGFAIDKGVDLWFDVNDDSHVHLESRTFEGIVDFDLRVSYGAVLGAFCDVLKRIKTLIINMLNDVYIVAAVVNYAYFCEAKNPYYGRSTYRYRAHDNASPLQDAAGSRGIVCKG